MIRKYEERDLDGLLSTWAAASEIAHPFLTDEFLASERENIPNLYLPNAETWVFEDDGTVVGFVALIGNEVGAIFVHPEFHRNGIGQRLMDQAREVRHELEVEVFTANTIGRAFYTKYGFEIIEEKVHAPTGQDVLRLRLSATRNVESTEFPQMTMTHSPTVRKPHEGRTIAVVGDIYRFLATGEETDGKYAMWEAIVPPGGGPPPHIHRREEESFYILEGEITFTVGEEEIIATQGMFANMPVGRLHSFKNTSDKLARMIISVAPAGLEEMFFEFGVPLEEGSTEALPPTKEEIDKLLQIAPNYGIEIKVPGH